MKTGLRRTKVAGAYCSAHPEAIDEGWNCLPKFWANSALILWFGLLPCLAQNSNNITITAITNGSGQVQNVQMAFQGRADSYYLLTSSFSLSESFQPVDAMLGGSGGLSFGHSVSPSGAVFFRVEQLLLSSTNDLLGDGIADGFKLQHGLPVFGPTYASVIPFGDTRTWLEIYQSEANLAALPLAYFPASTYTVVVGSGSVSVPVAFSKPYTGQLTYQLSGTAIPNSSGVAGDYMVPAAPVLVTSATTANVLITLVPEPDIEINRSIVIALSAPPLTNHGYTITTNSSIATVQIVQSTLGVFVGTLTITNGLFVGAQSAKLALRPGSGNSTFALLDITGNSLLGNTFSIPVSASTNGFQLNGAQFSNVVTNTPWGRNLNVSLSFGATQTNGTAFTTPVTMSLVGLTASGLSYSGSGTLDMARSQ